MPELPRGPIFNPENLEPDYTDHYTNKLREWREAARQEAFSFARSNPEYSEAARYIQTLEGQFWDRRRPPWRSHFYDNRLMEARIEAMSLLTDIRPTIEVSSKVAAYEEQAKVANLIIRAEWSRQDMDLSLMEVVDHALLATGYWKVGAGAPGYLTVTACGFDSVLPIQPISSVQDATAVLYRAVKPIGYFLTRWPHLRDRLLAQARRTSALEPEQIERPLWITEYQWNSLSAPMRRLLGLRSRPEELVRTKTFPTLELEEYWIDDLQINDSPQAVIMKDPWLDLESHNWHYRVEPGQPLYPRKRLIIFAGDEPIYDGPSPYWHGLYPFVQLSLNPTVWCPFGLSKYRDLLPLNEAINQITAGVLDAIEKAVNPQVVTKENAIREAAWRKFFAAQPGGKLQLTPISDVSRDLRYMEPPPIPAYVMTMLQGYLIPTFDRHSGAVDVAQLGRRRQVPAGETIEQMRDVMQARFRIESRRLEAFLRRAGLQFVSNIFQFYTRRQRMRLLGADGLTWQDFDYDPDTMVPHSTPPEDHWKLFAVDIAQGSTHSGSKDRAKQIAIVLYRLGAISRRELLRRLEFGNIAEIEREIMEERAAGIGPTSPGRTPRMTRAQRTAQI